MPYAQQRELWVIPGKDPIYLCSFIKENFEVNIEYCDLNPIGQDLIPLFFFSFFDKDYFYKRSVRKSIQFWLDYSSKYFLQFLQLTTYPYLPIQN